MSSEIKKWLVRVSGAVGGTLVIMALVAQLSHYARSGETEERTLENKQRNVEQDAKLKPIRDLVEVLGKRMVAEDAAYEERAKLCRMGLIQDDRTCREVGEEVVE